MAQWDTNQSTGSWDGEAVGVGGGVAELQNDGVKNENGKLAGSGIPSGWFIGFHNGMASFASI